MKTGSVENTALSPDEEDPQKRAGSRGSGGIWTTLSRDIGVYIRATLRHFEHKVRGKPKTGPLIPCERRLPRMEISVFQELTFRARFGYRDYGRPFEHFLVTLPCFD